MSFAKSTGAAAARPLAQAMPTSAGRTKTQARRLVNSVDFTWEILHPVGAASPAGTHCTHCRGRLASFERCCDRDAFSLSPGEMTVEAGLVSADFVLRHGLLPDPDGTLRTAVEACRADAVHHTGSVG